MPVLVLDAGNALFKSPLPDGDPKVGERARFLLEQLDAVGTRAMAVGARDLSLGTDFLAKASKGAKKLKLLSANLVDAGGKPLFPASLVVTEGGVKFGLVGISPEGPVAGQPPGGGGRPPVPAALAEARRLREKEQVDVVVVLAAVPYVEATRLSQQAGNTVDFIVQSHEGRGAGVAQRNDYATLIPPGERGRQLARLELSVDGKGPSVDLTEAERARENLKLLDANIQQAKARLAALKDESARRALEEAVASFESRRKQLVLQAGGNKEGLKRTHRLSYIQLGSDVADDPELKKRVERIEPPGSASH
ncbi:5'-nucleotidase [Archangium sp.]|uniref:5'-nucleotidase n=1 Tax=Archangium sp. TaxID=1872627 RepID=UPI002EDA3FC9